MLIDVLHEFTSVFRRQYFAAGTTGSAAGEELTAVDQ